jgi:hypothetical protein
MLKDFLRDLSGVPARAERVEIDNAVEAAQ